MLNARMMSMIAVALIAGQLIIRGWLVATGDFYWDDLVLIARASSNPILSWEYLGHSHDGHFMPAAFLLAGVATWLAPVNWVLPALPLDPLLACGSRIQRSGHTHGTTNSVVTSTSRLSGPPTLTKSLKR